nr:NTP transferase domain-containing protein [Moraxella sp. CTOTU49097]
MSVNPSNLTVVILAAGLSQRLGFAKQLIVKNHQTLLAEKIQLARQLQPHQVLVVLPKLDNPISKALYNEVAPFDVTVVDNPTPQTGMAQSIQYAMTTLQQQLVSATMRTLFLTVDQVAITLDDLSLLSQKVEDHQLIVSEYGDNNRPIWGIPVNLPWGFLRAFGHQLQGDKGFRALWQHQTTIVSPADSKVYQLYPIPLTHLSQDIDTLAQFEQLKTAYHLLAPTQHFN